jgi:integrase
MLADGGGLYLQISAVGVKTWIFRFQIAGGKRREMGLGAIADVSLAEARDKARDARKLAKQGGDPIERRRSERVARSITDAKAMTFRQCAEAYIAAHQAGWRNPKHAAQWPSTLQTYVYPIVGELPVMAVDRPAVLRVLSPIWNEKPETASRVRGRIESILGWATQHGYRTDENPAMWKGAIEHALPQKSKVRRVEHHAALPYGELAAFMLKLRQQEGIAARALEFAILTAARTGEVIGAAWAEINRAGEDAEARLWTIPGSRMKAGKEHRVPLSGPACAVLAQMQAIRQNEFVFPGHRIGRPLSNMAMLMLLRRMGRGDLTAHGFRSAFSDWCAEQTNTPSEVREMALAHAVGDKVEAAYRRGDLFEKRRELMAAWGRYCCGGGGNVVELRPQRIAGM